MSRPYINKVVAKKNKGKKARMIFFSVYRANAGKFGDYVYEKPYTRLTPYIVGLGLGYIFSRKLRFPHNLKYVSTI